MFTKYFFKLDEINAGGYADDHESKKSLPLENLRLPLTGSASLSITEFIYSESLGSADDIEDPKCRSKKGIFHEFQDLLLGKTCPVKNAIYRLLIQDVFLFVNEDFDKVKNPLIEVKKITVPMLEHYYFNREW